MQQLQNSEEKDITKGLDKETSERLGAFALTTTLTVTGFNPDATPILQTTVFGMEEIYQATKNLGQMDKEQSLEDTAALLLATYLNVAKITNNGIEYDMYDNGNGEVLMGADIIKD